VPLRIASSDDEVKIVKREGIHLMSYLNKRKKYK